MLPSVEVSLTALLRTLLIALTSLTLTCDLDFHLTLRAVVRPIHLQKIKVTDRYKT